MTQGYIRLMMQFKILSTMLHLYVKPPPCLTKAKSLVGARSQDKKRVRRQSSGLPFTSLPSNLTTLKSFFSLMKDSLTGLPALLTRMRSVLGLPRPDLITQLFFTIRGEFDVEEEERFKTWSACGVQILKMFKYNL